MNKKTPDEEKDVTKVEHQKTDLAVVDYGDDAGAGMEDVSRDEYAVPFLSILDAKSRFVKPVAAGGIAGAVAGAIFNGSTNEVFGGEAGVTIIPVHRDHHFVEWIPKNEDGSGGGFVGIRQDSDPLVARLQKEQSKFGKLKTPDNTELVETYYLYALLVNDGVGYPVLIAFSTTQIKKYRQFMTRVMSIQYQGPNGMVRPPLWAHAWRFRSVWETKGKLGREGFGWRIALVKEPAIESRLKMTDPLYQQARSFYDSIKAGKVVVKEQEPEHEPGADLEKMKYLCE